MVAVHVSVVALSILIAFSVLMILSNTLPNVDNVFVMTMVISLQLTVLTGLVFRKREMW